MSELPEGWITTTIGNVTTDAQQRQPQPQEDFLYIDISSIDRETKRIQNPQRIKGENAPSRARKVVSSGDVLVSMTRPNLNAVAIVSSELHNQIASTGLDILRATGIEPRWLFYLVRSNDFVSAMSDLVQGALYPAVRSKDIRSFEIPLAPLTEQKRIADKLDVLLARVDACRERLARVPVILKRFRQAVLAAATSGQLTEDWREENNVYVSAEEVYGSHKEQWEIRTYEELKEKGKLNHSTNWKSKYKDPASVDEELIWVIPENWCWTTIDSVAEVTKLAGFEFTEYVQYVQDGDLPVIKAENVGTQGFKKTNYSKVNSDAVKMLTRSELFGGEILMVFVGAGVAQVARVPEEQKFFLGPNVAVVKQTSSYYDAKYLELFLRSNSGKKISLSFAKGAAQSSLSMGQIRQISVALPPLPEQHEIVRRVEILFAYADRLTARTQAARAQVDQLTPSLLAKALRGELVPQNATDEPAAVLLERLRTQRKIS